VGTLKRNGYSVEKVIYESRPEHHVTANLYLPEGKGPFPGVLMPVGHSANGKAAGEMQRAAILLAKNGMAALVYDPIGQGERNQLLDKLGNPAIKGSTSEHTMCGVGALLVGRNTASYRVWDGIRSLDYLADRPEIDPKKLGCTGCSGGGTLTSYLMALDDRIAAAAPSCYITSLERLFATIGPQDAEQNITGQVAFHMDHADYIFLRAPRPTLVLCATEDFFDIQGTWTTFREQKRIYNRLRMPERLDIVEVDGRHGYPKEHREAMARFMHRWLKGVDRAISEEVVPIEKDADLRCTRSGQVLDDFRGRSVFDLNAALATEYAKKRAPGLMDRFTFRKVVARVIGPAQDEGDPRRFERFDPFTWNSAQARRVKYSYAKSGVLMAGVWVSPVKPIGPLVIYANDRGKKVVMERGGPVEQLVRAGREVLVVDLRGWGETAPSDPDKVPPFGLEYKEAFLSLHLNRPLLGQRVRDLLAIISNGDSSTVELVGAGAAAPVVLHAAVLDNRVRAITLDGGLVSWDSVLRTPISHNQLASVVPGVLKEYDLPDLAERLAPRPLTIRNPVDAAGQPLSKEAAEDAYKGVREAYKLAKAEDKFTLIVGAK
jgi:dienelactone hydrolase